MPDTPNNSTSVNPDSPPEYVAHYRILGTLGKGGMGEVFLGEDTKQHDRKVALKVLSPELTREESRLRRFKQEARAVLALNHPNILTVFEIGQTGLSYYIATEHIEGETLRQCIWSNLLPLDEALGVAIQVAMALEAAMRRALSIETSNPKTLCCGRIASSATDCKGPGFWVCKVDGKRGPSSDPRSCKLCRSQKQILAQSLGPPATCLPNKRREKVSTLVRIFLVSV